MNRGAMRRLSIVRVLTVVPVFPASAVECTPAHSGKINQLERKPVVLGAVGRLPHDQ